MTEFNFYKGASVSSWLLTILIILAELITPFKNLLKTMFSHHWIGKIVIVALSFLIIGFLFKEKKSDEKMAWKNMIINLIIILIFFILIFILEAE